MNKKGFNYIAIAMAWLSIIFHIYLIFSGLIPNLVSRPIHFLLCIPWVFFFAKNNSKASQYFAYAIGVLAILSTLYILINYQLLSDQYGSLYTKFQFIVAIILLLSVLEMARRSIKWPLPTVALAALIYGIFGNNIPGLFGYSEIPLASFLGTLTIAEGGIWGSLTGISANVVAVFVILGAVIGAGDAGHGFMALAIKLAGRFRGGAAKVAVISSALFGSISGSASANVASTGAITLPMMKKLKYPVSFAAATEAVASTGGQIAPPLMGAGAFVMVELLQVSYTSIMQAAILPALLFFIAAWFGIDNFAKIYQLVAMKASDMPTRQLLISTTPFFLIPFILLLFLLFAFKYSAQLSAGYAILLSAVMLFLNRQFKISIKQGLLRINEAAMTAAKQIATIASIIICAGIVIGVLNQTGLGIKITSMIISISGGELWIALLLTALACLILGMEVPTTAAYLICISVAGPALHELGLPLLHAHFFVFWYALLSTITPPVCGTVFIASGMIGAPWINTSISAMRLGIGLYLIPLAMVAQPAILEVWTSPFKAILSFIQISIALWFLSKVMIDFKARNFLLNVLFIIVTVALMSLKIP